MANMWYYARGGHQIGPVPGAVLKQLAAAGDLLPTDLILKAGSTQWRPAGAASGLFPDSKSETRNQPDQEGLVSKFSKTKHPSQDLDAIDLIQPYSPVQASVQPAPNSRGPRAIDDEQGVLI